MITINLQSTYKEEMDVSQLTDKGFFTVFSCVSPHIQGNFGLGSLCRRRDKELLIFLAHRVKPQTESGKSVVNSIGVHKILR